MWDAFYEADGNRFVPTLLCRGPWDDRFQHGGPPAALMGGAMAAMVPDSRFLCRITVELLRPVPLSPLVVATRVLSSGRTVDRLGAVLSTDDGTAVAEATALRIARSEVAVPDPDPVISRGALWPLPEALLPYHFGFFQSEWGYHRAIGLRLAIGTWGTTPVGFWARPEVALVCGRPITPLERTLILADAQSGMGPPLDPARYTFVNPDLTVYLERDPAHDQADDWIGFDIRSVAGPHGVGLSQSELRDRRGPFGRSLQALVVALR